MPAGRTDRGRFDPRGMQWIPQLVKKCPTLGATTTITKEQAVVDILCFPGDGTLGNASEFMEKLLG